MTFFFQHCVVTEVPLSGAWSGQESGILTYVPIPNTLVSLVIKRSCGSTQPWKQTQFPTWSRGYVNSGFHPFLRGTAEALWSPERSLAWP